MFKAVRRHINVTSVVAMLALVLAMTGGAYAAGVIKITSIKQISKKVVNELRGHAGAKGANGTPGAAGAQGPGGPQGTAGTAGKDGANGVSVTGEEIKVGEERCAKVGGVEYTAANGKTPICNGKTGKEGPTGQPWTPNSFLPKGATETGVWGLQTTKESPIFLPVASFTIQLEKALDAEHVHVIKEGKELKGEELVEPTGCGEPVGTAEEPTAESGNFCIYVSSLEGAQIAAIASPETKLGAGKTGALMLLSVSESAAARGSWAVTG